MGMAYSNFVDQGEHLKKLLPHVATHDIFNSMNGMCVYTSMGNEWSFDNMITSPEYQCVNLAYDPS